MGDFKLPRLVAEIRRLLRSNQHYVIGIVGKSGLGKSSLALQLADKIQPGFDPLKQMVRGEANVEPLAKRLGKKMVIMCDEPGEGGNVRGYMTKANRSTADFMDATRKRCQCLIYLRPKYRDYDPTLKSHFHLLIVIGGRGGGPTSQLFKPQDGQWSKKPFNRPITEPMRYRACEDVKPELWEKYCQRIEYLIDDEDAVVARMVQVIDRVIQA